MDIFKWVKFMYEAIYLDYQMDDLSPYIQEDNLKANYQVYQENLNTLNQLLKEANYDYTYSLRDLVDHIDIFPLSIRGEILYYLSSVLNHNLYFYNMSNKNNTIPSSTIGKDITKYFGSFEEFKNEFIKNAMNLKGSGYTFLVLDEKRNLKIINTSNEDSPYYYGMTPIISLDLWEHAYYLQYQNNKLAYIENFLKVIDFEKINRYYEKIKNT